jgi:hypothetical protein
VTATPPVPAQQGAGDKRGHSVLVAEHVKQPQHLSLATAMPLHVWQDHLMPLCRRLEAVRLRRVCKALRRVVNEWPMKLGRVFESQLKDALICFPAAEGLELDCSHLQLRT